jgi:Cof subfamily protein (haloacid dehalogenase superfamily)
MYRLIATDLDGTLLTPQHTLSAHTIAVLQQAVAAGMKLVVATGRVPYIFHTIGAQLPLNAPQITNNGAVIIDTHTNEILHNQLVPPDLIPPLLDALRLLALEPCYYSNEIIYAERALYERNNWYLQGVPVSLTDNIADLVSHPCFKIAAFGDASTIRTKRAELARIFDGQLYVTQTAQEWLEFMHPQVSKGKALKMIAHMLDILPEEIIAFGDNHNDIEMLRYAGLGIAMENAHDEVKNVAAYVTQSNAQDGVAAALEKFVLAPAR